ncbi:MAG: alpha/beta hydrolase [Bacteroidota bacterium]
MKLYGISGLGADRRVFDYLKLDYEFVPIEWIDPIEGEMLADYATRLSQTIDTNEKFGILGVSFGGLVTVEISKKLHPAISILISSAEVYSELRILYRIIGQTNLLKFMPSALFDPPRALATWVFGAKNKDLLEQILNDTDLKFAKWAVNQLLTWKNKERLKTPILKIAGTNDRLIPPSENGDQVMIEQGAHFMIVDRADEISQIINNALKKID